MSYSSRENTYGSLSQAYDFTISGKLFNHLQNM